MIFIFDGGTLQTVAAGTVTLNISYEGRSRPLFPFKPKLYSVSRISNFAHVKNNNNNNSQLNFRAQKTISKFCFVNNLSALFLVYKIESVT